ncbi:MAG: DUF4244 domain-containing protein [Nocardioides sp.]
MRSGPGEHREDEVATGDPTRRRHHDRHSTSATPATPGASSPPDPALRRLAGRAGITTAEYAAGTAAGAGLAGLLFEMLTGAGTRLLTTLFDHVLGLLGLG